MADRQNGAPAMTDELVHELWQAYRAGKEVACPADQKAMAIAIDGSMGCIASSASRAVRDALVRGQRGWRSSSGTLEPPDRLGA
ncbi:MAG: hypothetical protein U0235_07110 [Polyangiaceae bacterium]